jgi:hypothetical protein
MGGDGWRTGDGTATTGVGGRTISRTWELLDDTTTDGWMGVPKAPLFRDLKEPVVEAGSAGGGM